jgi:hypothetical protein
MGQADHSPKYTVLRLGMHAGLTHSFVHLCGVMFRHRADLNGRQDTADSVFAWGFQL